MKDKIIYAGIDVDDKNYHVCLFDQGELDSFSTPPDFESLSKKLKKKVPTGARLKCCYEACHLGFKLQKELSSIGYECEVIAPSLIPKVFGHKIKTDRIDAEKLAEFYAAGLLRGVYIPDEEIQAVRALIRSRKFLTTQLSSLKNHIVSTCRFLGWEYKKDMGKSSACHHWTKEHRAWLAKKLREEASEFEKANLEQLVLMLEKTEERIDGYNVEIEKLATNKRYEKQVNSLTAYRGLSVLSAMQIVAEIGDIRRFDHPKNLMSYTGLSIKEYSSGGKQRQFSITKTGNKFLRTVVVEACQRSHKAPYVGRLLIHRRKNTAQKYIHIADRCMERLTKKSRAMLAREKPVNKIKVACAREMLGFIWESLKAAA